MTFDPLRREWPVDPTPEEQRLAAALVGHRLVSVEHEADGAWEAAYLRTLDRTVAVAAVDVAGRSYSAPALPWRIALIEVSDELPEMRVEVTAPGTIEAVEFYAQDAVDAAVALRCTDEVIWLRCAGGDYVQIGVGDAPAEVARLPLARRLPR